MWKIVLALYVTVLFVLPTAAQQRPVTRYDASAIDALAKRMNALTGTGWQEGFAFGNELADLPRPVGYAILRDNWFKGASVASRKQMFKGFVFNDHPDTLLVLNLGMHDPNLSMQNWTISYLRDISYINFADDFDAYAVWFDKYKSLPLAEVKRRSLQGALDRLLTLPEDQVNDVAMTLTRSEFNAASLKGYANLDKLFDRLVTLSPGSSSAAELTGKLLHVNSIPLSSRTAVALRLLQNLANLKNSFLMEAAGELNAPDVTAKLKEILQSAVTAGKDTSPVLNALIATGEPKVVPYVIALLPQLSDNQRQQVGSQLSQMVGVQPPADAKPDWWGDWLKRNKTRFGMKSDVSALPTFTIKAVPASEYIPDADDVSDIPSRVAFVGGDTNKRYFLSGAMQPAQRKNILVVLPGGDGSPDFHPFIKRIQKNVLDGNWIVAQPIAPHWDDNPERVVWPSEGNPYTPAKFTMEQFIDSMLDEIQSKQQVKLGKIVFLGWSSSGPALYSYLAHGKHSIDGAFIAMSIFRSSMFGDTQSLHVKRVYLLHSPEDKIPIAQAQEGERVLKARGIPVQLQTYAGGHGWHGNVYGMIQQGITFLNP